MPRTIWLVMIGSYPGEAFLSEKKARKFRDEWKGQMYAAVVRVTLADWEDRFLYKDES